MALEMRTRCERCGTALEDAGDARICSYECTFCEACAGELGSVCPNCGGELVPRPRRVTAGLEDTSWTLELLNGQEPRAATVTTASFAGGRVSGSAGCNRYVGSYTVDGSNLSLGPLAVTRMACEPAVMEQESAFLAALGAAISYAVEGAALEIAYPEGTLRFTG